MAGGFDMNNLFQQAQQMQRKMRKIKRELADRVVEGSAGGGMVTAQVNGKQEVLRVKIDEEADTDDLELLEDMIVAAVNQGLQKADELAQEEMSKATGGLDMGGLANLFGG